MGRCWRCDRELRLIGSQWLCDNCNEPIGYKCWNCGEDFSIRDTQTKKNIPECSACGFYICPNCHSCAEDCPKIKWAEIILNILAGQLMLDGSLIITNYQERVKRIVQLIEDLKSEKKEHKVCPNYVYASYARGKNGEQGRIKQLLAKMNGIGTKSELDAEGFRKKFKKIMGLEEGNSFTVRDLREDGRYGQEERDACNLGICMGELSAHLHTNKKNQKAIVYNKINKEGQCEYLRKDNFVTKRCPQCHKDYNNPQLEYYQPNLESCPTCIFKRGKNKNNHPTLIINETNTFTCNCPWGEFMTITEEEKEENGIET